MVLDLFMEDVEDADEELFWLYSRRAMFKPAQNNDLMDIAISGLQNSSELGLLDQKSNELELEFSIQLTAVEGGQTPNRNKKNQDPKTIHVKIAQDITALRTRKGDTGGALWRGSVLLGNALLQQIQEEPPSPLFGSLEILGSHILELGSGTGLLGLVLSPIVSQYRCTDLPELVPLIRKNIQLNPHLDNGHLTVEALDWVNVLNCPLHSRHRIFPTQGANERGPNLILAVDCIYNPSLIPPLLATIDHFATPLRTKCLVAMELRDEDVVREFLTQWMSLDGWHIQRLDRTEEKAFLDERFVVWVGSKVSPITENSGFGTNV